MEQIQPIGDWIKWIAGVGGAAIIIYGWIAGIVKPLRKINALLEVVPQMQADIEKLKDASKITSEDTADILCDRLNQAYDHWMRKGYCPKADKTRLVEMHQRYSALGRNHLTEHYERDLIALPEYPQTPEDTGRRWA